MFVSLWYTVGESGTRDAPPCSCLPLSLFDLIAVPLYPLLLFISLYGALVVLVLALSPYLGCLAPLIYVYGCLSCPTHIICGCPGLFCFCSLVFPPPESLPGDDVLCRLLPRPLPSVCFLFFSFPTVFAPNLFWCNFLYLVTTAGFVADQLMMWDRQQRVRLCVIFCVLFLICLLPAI